MRIRTVLVALMAACSLGVQAPASAGEPGLFTLVIDVPSMSGGSGTANVWGSFTGVAGGVPYVEATIAGSAVVTEGLCPVVTSVSGALVIAGAYPLNFALSRVGPLSAMVTSAPGSFGGGGYSATQRTPNVGCSGHVTYFVYVASVIP